MSNNNNMRDQFPGIAKVDSLIDFIAGAITALGWIYMFIYMLSGWYLLLKVRSKDQWYKSMDWATRVLALWALSFLVGMIIILIVGNTPTRMNWLIAYPFAFIAFVGMIGGLVVRVLAYCINWVGSTRESNKVESKEIEFAKKQGWYTPTKKWK